MSSDEPTLDEFEEIRLSDDDPSDDRDLPDQVETAIEGGYKLISPPINMSTVLTWMGVTIAVMWVFSTLSQLVHSIFMPFVFATMMVLVLLTVAFVVVGYYQAAMHILRKAANGGDDED